MKWLKKIIIGLLMMILVNCLVLLAVSFSIQEVLIDGVVKETIISQLLKKEVNTENHITEDQIDEVTDDERIKAILNTKEMQELIDKYMEITINGLTDEKQLEEITLEEDMLNYLKEHKEEISQIVGADVTDEMIEDASEQLESKEMSRTFKETIQNTSRIMTTREKTILKGYKLLISDEIKMILIGIIILIHIFLIILVKPFYEILKVDSRTLISSGILIEIMCIGVSYLVSKLSLRTIKMTPLVKVGIVYLTIGLSLRIIYEIIKMIRRKNNEIS